MTVERPRTRVLRRILFIVSFLVFSLFPCSIDWVHGIVEHWGLE